MIDRFRSPRRVVMTSIAVVLGLLWLSQLLAGIFLRQPADPEMLIQRISIGLFAFLVWQVIKIIFRTPVEPFEWTPSELQMLKSAPVTRRQLVGYRLTTILSSVMVKAFIFMIVMIPDLNVLLLGVAGMALALAFTEFVKNAAEIVAFGFSKRTLMAIRTVVAVFLVAVLLTAICSVPDAQDKLSSPAAIQFVLAVGGELASMTNSGLGALLRQPMLCFTQIIVADRVDGWLLLNLGLGGTLSTVAFLTMMWLDARMVQNRRRQETIRCRSVVNQPASERKKHGTTRQRVTVPFRIGGAGSIAWRQFLGAYHYRYSIFFSFLLPVILCCLPLFATNSPQNMKLFLVGSILFYSYLLLPAALMLDFRRDVDRLQVLKSLPVSPLAVVVGQLSAPVVLCSVFQAIVFLIASLCSAVPPGWAAGCWLAMIPANVLIIASENLIFMLHPYRRNKEGVDVFIRSILTFTGKGIVWAMGIGMLACWLIASNWIFDQCLSQWLSPQTAVPLVFCAGALAFVMVLNVLLVRWLCQLFRQFDPASDSVAMN